MLHFIVFYFIAFNFKKKKMLHLQGGRGLVFFLR